MFADITRRLVLRLDQCVVTGHVRRVSYDVVPLAVVVLVLLGSWQR